MPHAERRTRGGARHRILAAGGLLGCTLLLAGCASMPDSGSVGKVGEEPRADSDPQVRVFGLPPQKNDSPTQIVHGFLEATTSDEARYQTAEDYLTGPARKWDPAARITVLSDTPQLAIVHNEAERSDTSSTIALTAGRVAEVDSKLSYTPDSRPYHASFHLSRVKGEWRIDALPDGLVLGQQDFGRIYRSVNMYYFARPTEQAQDSPPVDDLVADPVYVRRRIDPVTSSVQALLAGPSTWLHQVVESEFPPGTRLAGRVLGADTRKVRVPLDGLPAQLPAAQCERMAAQLLNTVEDQSRKGVTSAEVTRADGSSMCTLGQGQAKAFALKRLVGDGKRQYFVDAARRVESLPNDDSGDPKHVPGPFGDPGADLRTVAVSRDERTAAGVKSNGRTLVVAPLDGPGVPKSVVTSTYRLSAPSWDGLGDLWVADLNPAAPRLVMWHPDAQVPVAVPDLGAGRITSVRVAADGVRIALLVVRGGHTVLQLGNVKRGGTEDHPKVSVLGLRTVAPALEDVDAVSWAGGSRLVVVGKQRSGVQQLQYVDTDGSAPFTPILPGISTLTAVAAFENQTRPLLVASKEGMFWLQNDSEWEEIPQKGTAPVYPG